MIIFHWISLPRIIFILCFGVLEVEGLCTECPQMLDLAFLLDSSGSVNHHNDTNWNSLLRFVSDTVAELSIGPRHVQVGVVSFGDAATVNVYLNSFSSKNRLRYEIENIKYVAGNTYTAHGLKYLQNRLFVEEHGDRESAENVAILIVDGESNVGSHETIPAARSLQEDGVHLIAVGVGEYVRRDYLESITTNPHAIVMVESYNYNILKTYVDTVLNIVTDNLPAGTGQFPLPETSTERTVTSTRSTPRADVIENDDDRRNDDVDGSDVDVSDEDDSDSDIDSDNSDVDSDDDDEGGRGNNSQDNAQGHGGSASIVLNGEKGQTFIVVICVALAICILTVCLVMCGVLVYCGLRRKKQKPANTFVLTGPQPKGPNQEFSGNSLGGAEQQQTTADAAAAQNNKNMVVYNALARSYTIEQNKFQ